MQYAANLWFLSVDPDGLGGVYDLDKFIWHLSGRSAIRFNAQRLNEPNAEMM